MKYSTGNAGGARLILFILLLAVIAAGIGYLIGSSGCAEEQMATCWIMCKPGSQVNVRRKPDGGSMSIGYLEAGDDFSTDGTSSDGWIRCYGIGEDGEGWVWCGYVVTEKPEKIGERYVCVANKRVACRRWIGGPQVERSPWLKNGSTVDVFCMADGWAVTSRGYIRSEWLEADPE